MFVCLLFFLMSGLTELWDHVLYQSLLSKNSISIRIISAGKTAQWDWTEIMKIALLLKNEKSSAFEKDPING